jgi:hypothetical protein
VTRIDVLNLWIVFQLKDRIERWDFMKIMKDHISAESVQVRSGIWLSEIHKLIYYI